MSSLTVRAPGLPVVLGLLLLGVAELGAFDGPPIGVLIAEGRPLELGGGRADEALVVDTETGLERLPAGPWVLRFEGSRAVLAPGSAGEPERVIEGRPFRLRGDRSETTSLTLEADRLVVEGWVEVLPPEGPADVWRVVNRLQLEPYLLGVIGAEMPAASFPAEALAAQAIASRTFALFQLLARPADTRWHVRRSERSQVYAGAGQVHPATRSAVSATHGQVLMHDEQVFEAYFHATCGGETARAHDVWRSPLIQPLSGGVLCGYCSESPHFAWQAQVGAPEVTAALAPLCREHGIQLAQVQALEGVEPGVGGHAGYVRVVHGGGSFEVDGERLRAALGSGRIKSTRFECRSGPGGVFHFTGRGFGHGVGLCQWGAGRLARDGYDAVAILQFYYPGAKVYELW